MLHVYDDASFRIACAAYADPTAYPVDVVTGYFTLASTFMDPCDGPALCGAQLQLALNYLSGHLINLYTKINAGKAVPAGVITGSSVDRISVSIQPPPIRDQWENWLSQSPYGQMLWALLTVAAVGGFAIGLSLEQEGYRKAGGVF
jgi:hypothetical protein